MGRFHRGSLAWKLGVVSLLAILIGSVASSSFAQENYKAPPRQFLDPLGIDMPSATFPRSDTFLTIGDGASGLSWTYKATDSPLLTNDYRGYIGDACTAPPPIFSMPDCSDVDTRLVWIGQSATTFEPGTGGTYVNWSGTSATLTVSGGTSTYVSDDGTIYAMPGGLLTTITRPNGVKITINRSGSDVVSAVTNTGFAFKFSGTPNAGTVYAVNMIAPGRGCDSQALSCNGYDNSIVVSGNQVTDPAGGVWSYTFAKKYSYKPRLSDELVWGPRVLKTFQDPTGYNFTIARAARGAVSSFTDPRGTFTYSGQSATAEPNDSYTSTVKNPASIIIYQAGLYPSDSMISGYVDGLSRVTSYGYILYEYQPGNPTGTYSRITSVSQPEGNYLTYTYNVRGSVTQTAATPKAGSGLSAVTVYQAGYDTTCSNMKTCNQPNWTKDAKGNQTDYTYDGTHGGVLTVTLPADQNGLRTRTYNTYTAYDTGNGYIYRLTRTETCGLSSGQLGYTACPAATTTSVTTTDYGNSSTAPYTYKSFLPYSVTQTDGANSLAATTTYGYDVIGNVVWVDGPLAGSDDRVYKTYDAKRQVICEIGADPDGSGALIRAMVRHTYDGAGRELKTESGTGTSTTSCLSTNMTVASFSRMTYDLAGRLIKTEAVQP